MRFSDGAAGWDETLAHGILWRFGLTGRRTPMIWSLWQSLWLRGRLQEALMLTLIEKAVRGSAGRSLWAPAF